MHASDASDACNYFVCICMYDLLGQLDKVRKPTGLSTRETERQRQKDGQTNRPVDHMTRYTSTGQKHKPSDEELVRHGEGTGGGTGGLS